MSLTSTQYELLSPSSAISHTLSLSITLSHQSFDSSRSANQFWSTVYINNTAYASYTSPRHTNNNNSTFASIGLNNQSLAFFLLLFSGHQFQLPLASKLLYSFNSIQSDPIPIQFLSNSMRTSSIWDPLIAGHLSQKQSWRFNCLSHFYCWLAGWLAAPPIYLLCFYHSISYLALLIFAASGG